MKDVDLTIVGAGPAGMSAALFAEGDGLKFRLVDKGIPCRFVEEVINTNFTNSENYLGLYGLTGTETAQTFRQHLAFRNILVEEINITNINAEENSFQITSDKGDYNTKAIILATGTRPRKLRVRGIESFPHRIHYGIYGDLSCYSGKDVLVVGGRNSGAVTAIRLKEIGANPTIVEMGATSTAKEKYLDRLNDFSIPLICNATLETVVGDDEIRETILQSNRKRITMNPVAIFGCIGYVPNNELAKRLELKLDSQGFVEVNRNMQTSRQGIYAAGDLNGGCKMIAAASGEGATAEYYANSLIRSLKCKE